jgi:predicted nucleic acid-binding protein
VATYLLDTSAFSDLMRDDLQTELHLTAAASDPVVFCTIVRGEVLHGISRLAAGKRKSALLAKAEELFGRITCEPVTAEVADHYFRIRSECEQQGLVVAENDLWIAATTMALSAILVTRDSDFSRIRSLTTVDWSKP